MVSDLTVALTKLLILSSNTCLSAHYVPGAVVVTKKTTTKTLIRKSQSNDRPKNICLIREIGRDLRHGQSGTSTQETMGLNSMGLVSPVRFSYPPRVTDSHTEKCIFLPWRDLGHG